MFEFFTPSHPPSIAGLAPLASICPVIRNVPATLIVEVMEQLVSTSCHSSCRRSESHKDHIVCSLAVAEPLPLRTPERLPQKQPRSRSLGTQPAPRPVSVRTLNIQECFIEIFFPVLPPSFLFAGRQKGGAAVFVLAPKAALHSPTQSGPQPSGARPFDRSFAGRVPSQEAFLDVLPATFVARVWHGGPDVRPQVLARIGAMG